MTVKQRLKNFVVVKREIEYLENKIKNMRDRQTSIRSSSNTEEVPSFGNCEDKLSESIASYLDLIDEYTVKLNKLYIEQKKIEKLIEHLTPTERLLIRARYIDGETMECVCGIIGYSWRQTNRIHSVALSKLEKMA